MKLNAGFPGGLSFPGVYHTPDKPLSEGRISSGTSEDEAGAKLFYREALRLDPELKEARSNLDNALRPGR